MENDYCRIQDATPKPVNQRVMLRQIQMLLKLFREKLLWQVRSIIKSGC
jgi:hypothetical protein